MLGTFASHHSDKLVQMVLDSVVQAFVCGMRRLAGTNEPSPRHNQGASCVV